MHIIGAGLAGLLAANMLRHRNPTIFEKQKELPNNHSAVLRFRTSVVGDVVNIPFRKVKMIKAPVPWKNPVADALAYSYKNTSCRRSDRSITQGMVAEERFIAPPGLIGMLAERCNIKYDLAYDLAFTNYDGTPVISTMPMHVLMHMLNYKRRDNIPFDFKAGTNIIAKINACDAYVSLLVPDPYCPFSRISVTGDELIIEIPGKTERDLNVNYLLDTAASMLGLEMNAIYDVTVKEQRYAKILPIPDDDRKEFMHWATVHHNIYSLGRFATWRPNLLLDDLVKDIRLIDKWSSAKSKYDVAMVQ